MRTPIFSIMVRRALAVILILLLALVVVDRVRRSAAPARTSSSAASVPVEAGGDHRPRAPIAVPGLLPRLDSLTRESVRRRLTGEGHRQYLDSLFGETDSILRHWPIGQEILGIAIVPSPAPEYSAGLASEVRAALDAWNPAGAGLRFAEETDSARAQLVIRWTDTLDTDRAGVTDVTWDRAGRIRHASVVLALRSRATGRPFPPPVRRAVVLHELGHALGLPHSSVAGDVMYPVATAEALTDRDRFSLRLLYELPTGWIGSGEWVAR